MSNTIVFFGSGPVAAAALRLLAQDFVIEAVITKPQPPHHKAEFPVLAACRELNVTTVLPASNKQTLLNALEQHPLQSRLGLVIDFGIIIPQVVIDQFELGIVNSHFSLLPEWRGADPISFAILSGQAQTGVSLMLINDKMDEGLLLAQAAYDIPSDATTPELTDALVELSHKTLQTMLPLYIAGQLQPAPQEVVTIAGSPVPSYSRKLTKEDGLINWQKPAVEIEREIRAYSGWPKSRTTIAKQDVVITAAHVSDNSGKPGELWHDAAQFGVYTADKLLVIDRLIPAGKKEMSAAAFLAGHRLLA